MKRHSGPYSLAQKIGKLSSVVRGEQCTDTLRSCRNHMHVQKPWKVHVNIIVLPVTLTDVHDHLYRYGGFPPLVDAKLGYWEYTLKPNCKGDTETNRSRDGKSTMVSLCICNSHFEEDKSKLSPLDY